MQTAAQMQTELLMGSWRLLHPKSGLLKIC